jgi:hypothetical protein
MTAREAAEKPHRLNVVLPERTVERINWLRQKTLAASNTEVIRNALLTYAALVEQIAEGNRFYVSHPGENRFHAVNFVFDVVPNEMAA